MKKLEGHIGGVPVAIIRVRDEDEARNLPHFIPLEHYPHGIDPVDEWELGGIWTGAGVGTRFIARRVENERRAIFTDEQLKAMHGVKRGTELIEEGKRRRPRRRALTRPDAPGIPMASKERHTCVACKQERSVTVYHRGSMICSRCSTAGGLFDWSTELIENLVSYTRIVSRRKNPPSISR